jgi:GNAT superfamily N-acetyltransferase
MTSRAGTKIKVGDMELRPANLDDAAVVADIETQARPDEPADPKIIRHWWQMTSSDAVVRRYIGSSEGRDVAIGATHHLVWDRMPERFMRIGAETRPGAKRPARLDALFRFFEDEARREEARKLTAWAYDNDPERVDVITKRGFREERRQRFWECDLVANRERITKMAAESRERMKRERIEITTLDKITVPKKWEKLKRMSDEAEQDVPSTVPHVSMSMADWMKWWDSPALRPDRSWIAIEDDDIVGISQLAYPPVRGVVSTDWTATARKVRGRGVARALKCETLMQAIALGIDRVRTDNDSQNAPILHINETMGYRIRVEGIQFHKAI